MGGMGVVLVFSLLAAEGSRGGEGRAVGRGVG